jgi:hypothetical protein
MVLSDDNPPSMKYYLRNYSVEMYIQGNYSLPLQILVEDIDGVEDVILTYSFNNSPWSNVSMTEMSGESGWYEANLDFPSFEMYDRHSVDVQYAAKDTLGNWAITPLCVYSIYANPLTADIGVEVYDTPDLWYLVETTGHTITWSATAGYFYSLYEDGYLIVESQWSNPLTINVDGLETGDHVFKLYVSGGGWGDSDNVTVHVVASTDDIPFGAFTDSVEPNMPFNPVFGIPFLIWTLILAFIGSILVAISYRFLKR